MNSAEPIASPFSTGAGSQTAPLLSRRILLAEDSLESQRLLSLFLKRAGAEVFVADNGRIALEMMEAARAARQPFDLLLVDVEMPEMDGHSLTRALRQSGHALPILAITAHSTEDDRQLSLAAGCDEHATKPIDRDVLVRLCRQWLNRDKPQAG